METYQIEGTREFDAARNLENALNSYSWNPKRFAACVPTMHRTLQQTFFRTIVEVIRKMASDDFSTDARNRESHEIAKKIIESGALDDCYLPFI